jgi:hypothetical protein
MISTPAARNTDPNASHEAAEHITKTGLRAQQQRMASKAVEQHPGLTSLELSQKSHICRYMLARRLPEAETGHTVRRGPERKCTVSGRSACTWYPFNHSIQLSII